MWSHLPMKQSSELQGDDNVKLRTVQYTMVLGLKIIILRKKLLNCVRVIVGAKSSLRSTQIVDPRCDPHVCQSKAGLNRMLDKLEKRRLLSRRHAVVELVGRVAQGLPLVENCFCSDE